MKFPKALLLFILNAVPVLGLSYLHGAFATGLALGGIGIFLWPIVPFANWLQTLGLIQVDYHWDSLIITFNGLLWVLLVWLIGAKLRQRSAK